MTNASAQPPGWYPAQGDPAGTQRYWDGSQWQGGPQPIGGGAPTAGQPAPVSPAGSFGGAQPAEYAQRFMAYLVDFGIGLAIGVGGFVLVILAGFVHESLALIVLLLWMLAIFGFAIYNYIYLQGTTGQTIGKKQQGITLLSNKTGQPVGLLMVFVRGVLGGFLSQLCLLDYLWMFKGEERVRLSDQILEFQVRKMN